jgi:hypothetical protein
VFLLEPLGQPVVLRQIEIDDRVRPRRSTLDRTRRSALQQPSREVTGFGEKKQTDLGDVRSGRDVHQIVFLLWFEWITPRKVVQRTVDELEIPRIPEVDLVPARDGFRGDRADILDQGGRQPLMRGFVEQLESADQQVFMTANVDRRPPSIPAIRAGPAVEGRPDQADDDDLLYYQVS